MSWIRHKDLHIFSVGLLKYTSDSRYDIVHRPSTRFGFIKTNVYFSEIDSEVMQRYTYRVLQTIQMKLILLCMWAEPAGLGSTKTALKFFKNEFTKTIGLFYYNYYQNVTLYIHSKWI